MAIQSEQATRLVLRLDHLPFSRWHRTLFVLAFVGVMFDEYLVGYSETRRVLDIAGITGSLFSTINVRSGALILDTQLAGTWRRTIDRDRVLIQARLHTSFDDSQMRALQAEADRHAAFLGRQATLRVQV